MNLYISPSGRPHVTLEKNGKRYAFWPLFNKLEELSKQVPPEVKRVETIVIENHSGTQATTITLVGDPGKGKQHAIRLSEELAKDWHSDEQKDVSVNQGTAERTLANVPYPENKPMMQTGGNP